MKLKILIVDDNENVRSLIKSIITPYCVDILESSDGLSALEAFDKHQPDLVLMDIEMEKLNGLSATIKITGKHHHAKIMIVSSHDDEELRKLASEAGAISYVRKDNLFELPIIIKKFFPNIISLQFT